MKFWLVAIAMTTNHLWAQSLAISSDDENCAESLVPTHLSGLINYITGQTTCADDRKKLDKSSIHTFKAFCNCLDGSVQLGNPTDVSIGSEIFIELVANDPYEGKDELGDIDTSKKGKINTAKNECFDPNVETNLYFLPDESLFGSDITHLMGNLSNFNTSNSQTQALRQFLMQNPVFEKIFVLPHIAESKRSNILSPKEKSIILEDKENNEKVKAKAKDFVKNLFSNYKSEEDFIKNHQEFRKSLNDFNHDPDVLKYNNRVGDTYYSFLEKQKDSFSQKHPPGLSVMNFPNGKEGDYLERIFDVSIDVCAQSKTEEIETNGCNSKLQEVCTFLRESKLTTSEIFDLDQFLRRKEQVILKESNRNDLAKVMCQEKYASAKFGSSENLEQFIKDVCVHKKYQNMIAKEIRNTCSSEASKTDLRVLYMEDVLETTYATYHDIVIDGKNLRLNFEMYKKEVCKNEITKSICKKENESELKRQYLEEANSKVSELYKIFQIEKNIIQNPETKAYVAAAQNAISSGGSLKNIKKNTQKNLKTERRKRGIVDPKSSFETSVATSPSSPSQQNSQSTTSINNQVPQNFFPTPRVSESQGEVDFTNNEQEIKEKISGISQKSNDIQKMIQNYEQQNLTSENNEMINKLKKELDQNMSELAELKDSLSNNKPSTDQSSKSSQDNQVINNPSREAIGRSPASVERSDIIYPKTRSIAINRPQSKVELSKKDKDASFNKLLLDIYQNREISQELKSSTGLLDFKLEVTGDSNSLKLIGEKAKLIELSKKDIMYLMSSKGNESAILSKYLPQDQPLGVIKIKCLDCKDAQEKVYTYNVQSSSINLVPYRTVELKDLKNILKP